MIHIGVFVCGFAFCFVIYFLVDLFSYHKTVERFNKLEQEKADLYARIVRQRHSLALLNKKYNDLLKSKKDDQ